MQNKKNTILLFIVGLFSVLFIPSHLRASTRDIKVCIKIPDGKYTKEINLYNNSYALVIGNGNYKNGWNPLPGAIQDAKEIAMALKKNGFRVTLKTDLTKKAFDKTFSQFSIKYGQNSKNRLLFYYSGHGYTKKMVTGEELGYIVMIDAGLPEKHPIEFDLKSIDMISFVTQAKKILSRHVLFMFDSCFSGSIFNLRDRVIPQCISDNIRYPVRQFITSGRANESVPDHSVFKQIFLDILEGREQEFIPDGYLTGEELGLLLKNKVPEYNPSQHPQYGKIRDPMLDKGDFVFVLSKSKQESSSILSASENKKKPLTQEERLNLPNILISPPYKKEILKQNKQKATLLNLLSKKAIVFWPYLLFCIPLSCFFIFSFYEIKKDFFINVLFSIMAVVSLSLTHIYITYVFVSYAYWIIIFLSVLPLCFFAIILFFVKVALVLFTENLLKSSHFLNKIYIVLMKTDNLYEETFILLPLSNILAALILTVCSSLIFNIMFDLTPLFRKITIPPSSKTILWISIIIILFAISGLLHLINYYFKNLLNYYFKKE